MGRGRIVLAVTLALLFAAVAAFVSPKSLEAARTLLAQDDPVVLADHALRTGFDASVARQEIERALAADDADLAASFLALARDRGVDVDPALVAKVEAANGTAANAARGAGSFARGLVTGEPEDLAGLAGTAVGDLFVFGDIRDAVREGTRFASGQDVDEMVLGLACVGLAVTAGTYATLGASAPVRVGLTVLKAARKTGRLSARMGEYVGRSLRGMIDWPVLRSALAGASVSEPLTAIRATRSAVKMEKGQGLVRLVGDVGEVQAKAGTRAAFDALKIAESPREVTRISRLAAAKGNKTRAILKLFGRGVLILSFGAFNLVSWVAGAILSLLGFAASLKSGVERITLRRLARRRAGRIEFVTYARA